MLYSQGGAVEHGKEVYAMQKCSFCHSTDGGDKESLAGVGARLKPEEIRKWVQAPKTMKSDTRMKAYPNLPAKDLDGLVAYLGTLK
ncbi:MAG: cytochrome c [Acidobacteriota bacterium]|nr:cytochrome c [Acidobacteriota bacterium]